MATTHPLAQYEWVQRLGLQAEIDRLVEGGMTNEAMILNEIRQLPQHAEMFPGLFRPDGSLRMTEAQYFQQLDAYRTVYVNFGNNIEDFGPFEMAQMLENNISVQEFQERSNLYDQLRRGGNDIRDAFYVYAGIRMSDDDLYDYVVDGTVRQQFDQRYDQETLLNPPSYETFITRATEAGLTRVADALQDLSGSGVTVGQARLAIQNMNQDFARQMTDAIFQGTTGTPLGSLVELTNAFTYALIGGAASQQGLALPTAERIEEFRAAGVDRAAALQSYTDFAKNQQKLLGQVQRLNEGMRFTQQDFEQAVFLQDADAQLLMERAEARERAFGRAQGSAALQQRGQQLAQVGMTGMY